MRGALAVFYALELLIVGAMIVVFPIAAFFRSRFDPIEFVGELALFAATAGFLALAIHRLAERSRRAERLIVLLLPAAVGWNVYMDHSQGKLWHPLLTGVQIAALLPSSAAIVIHRLRAR